MIHPSAVILAVSNISGGSTPTNETIDWVKWLFDGIGAATIIALIGFLWKKLRPPPPVPVNATVMISDVRSKGNVLRETKFGTLQSWLDVTVRIQKGDFYITKGRHRDLRVEVVDIRKAKIPTRYGGSAPEEWAVELKIEVGGAIVFPGQRAVSVGVNHYLLPRVDHEESAESIYGFYLREGHFSFECFVVTHINPHDSCADIRIASLYLESK